jgi:hypothetical protein
VAGCGMSDQTICDRFEPGTIVGGCAFVGSRLLPRAAGRSR